MIVKLEKTDAYMQDAGIVFNIQKFSLHDGTGIRTNIFLKGCPMRCKWCSNPESQHTQPELLFQSSRCTGCGECVSACPSGAIALHAQGLAHTDRIKCTGCGHCEETCCSGARILQGKCMTIRELMQKIRNDEVFFRRSGGGVTLSGGEPLMQFPFALALAKQINREWIHLAVETCGAVSPKNISDIAPYVDCFLFDVKHMDPALHKQGTGADNSQVLANLRLLRELDAEVVLRVPVIPRWNDNAQTITDICGLARELRIKRLHLLPYHNFSQAKYAGLGRDYPMGNTPRLSLEDIGWLADHAKSFGLDVQCGG